MKRAADDSGDAGKRRALLAALARTATTAHLAALTPAFVAELEAGVADAHAQYTMRAAVILREHVAAGILPSLAPRDAASLRCVLVGEVGRNEAEDPAVRAAYRRLACTHKWAVDLVRREPAMLAHAQRTVLRATRDACATTPVPEHLRLATAAESAPDDPHYDADMREAMSLHLWKFTPDGRGAIVDYAQTLWRSREVPTATNMAFMMQYIEALFTSHGDEWRLCEPMINAAADVKGAGGALQRFGLFRICQFAVYHPDTRHIAERALDHSSTTGWYGRNVVGVAAKQGANCARPAFSDINYTSRALVAYMHCVTGNVGRLRELTDDFRSVPPDCDYANPRALLLDGDMQYGTSAAQADTLGAFVSLHVPDGASVWRCSDLCEWLHKHVGLTLHSFRLVARLIARIADLAPVLASFATKVPEADLLGVFASQAVEYTRHRVTRMCNESGRTTVKLERVRLSDNDNNRDDVINAVVRCARLFAVTDKAHVTIMRTMPQSVVDAYCLARFSDDARVRRSLRARPDRVPAQLRGADLHTDPDAYTDLLCAGDAGSLTCSPTLDVARAIACVMDGDAPPKERAALVNAVYGAAPHCWCDVEALVRTLLDASCDAPPPLTGAWEEAARAAFGSENVLSLAYAAKDKKVPGVVGYLQRVVRLCEINVPWTRIMNHGTTPDVVAIFDLHSPSALLQHAEVRYVEKTEGRYEMDYAHVESFTTYAVAHLREYGRASHGREVCSELGECPETKYNRLSMAVAIRRNDLNRELAITAAFMAYAPANAFIRPRFDVARMYSARSLRLTRPRAPKTMPRLVVPAELFVVPDNYCSSYFAQTRGLLLVLRMLAHLLVGGDAVPTAGSLLGGGRSPARPFHRAAVAWLHAGRLRGLCVADMPPAPPSGASDVLHAAWHAAAHLRELLVARVAAA